MAISIGELRGVLTLQDRFSQPAQNVGKQLGFMSESFRTVTQVTGIAAAAVTGTTAAIIALGHRGGEIANVRDSFGSLSAAIGQSGDRMLEVSKNKTKGLISDFDLMAAGNQAMLLGLPVTEQSLGTMAEAATVLGRAMKQDAGKSLQDLTTALGRSSPLILDNLGLTVKVGEANQAYGRELGKSTGELTEAEKKMAFYNAAMTAAQQKTEELGGIQLTFRDRIQRARVAAENFVDGLSVGVATSPVFAAGMDAVGEAVERAFGGRQQQAIQSVLGFLEGFAIGLVQAGQVGVEVARFIHNAWHGLQLIFNQVLGDLLGGLGGIVDGVALVLEAHAQIPGIGRLYEGAAATVRGVAADIEHLAGGFRAQAADALKAAGETNAGYDKVKGVLGEVETAMRGAMGANRDMGAAAADTAKATAELGEETGRASEASARLAEQNRRAWEEYARAQEEAAVQIADRTRQLEEELALANAEGLEKRLLDIQFQRDEELRGIEGLKVGYQEQYAELVEMINQKYAEMGAAAQRQHTSIAAGADELGFKTRAALEETALHAQETYERMLESGLFTTDTLRAAYEAAEEAKRQATGKTETYQLTAAEAVVQGTVEIFGVLGQKYKAAAIAGAIISTYQAIAKALASAPWPWSLALAAGAAATGWANVDRIRSSDAGWRLGTPGTEFRDFGRESLELLHGPEAVVTVAQGESLAGMVEQGIRRGYEAGVRHGASGRVGGAAERLRMRSGAGAAGGPPQQVVLNLQLAGRSVGEALLELSEDRSVRISQSAVIG